MYESLISSLNPKPRLNLSWNITTDQYSDGDVEDIIVHMLAENDFSEYTTAISNKFSWATFYHLTEFRKNILNWYPFKKDSSVLEIGCGFGAITDVLCEKCGSVTAVELSERRATGALLRCREYDNLEIIVGNLNDIKFEQKFDYITLIGVLEYQGKYTKTDNPYVDFLKQVKSFLKPDGKLLIAIENQFGIKYWCGVPEDHTGIPFDGMNNYVFSNSGVRTFSKSTLDKLIHNAGYENTYFYYPFPDYKLPSIIYSQDYLPSTLGPNDILGYNSSGKNSCIAQESLLYQELVDNRVLDFFANSFLVECSDSSDLGEVIFAKCNTVRDSAYKIGTRIYKDHTVEKFSLKPGVGQSMLQSIVNYGTDLSSHGIQVAPYSQTEDTITSSFVEGEELLSLIKECIMKKDKDGFLKIMDTIWSDILKSSDSCEPEDNIMFTFDGYFPEKDYGTILRKGYIDLIARNAFVHSDQLVWIDQEWMLENVPAAFIMFRNIKHTYSDCPDLEQLISCVDLFTRYNILKDIDQYINLETIFIQSVLDTQQLEQMNAFSVATIDDCVNNLNQLLAHR